MHRIYFMFLLIFIIMGCFTKNEKQNLDNNNIENYEQIMYVFENNYDSYYFIEDWYGITDTGEKITEGENIVLLKIIKNENNLFLEITRFMTNLPYLILVNKIAVLNNGKYEFEFIDGWENKAFGYIIYNSDNTITFFLDCLEFSDFGKNLGRLYGSMFILQKGSIEFD